MQNKIKNSKDILDNSIRINAACSLINKHVCEKHKFNEVLIASEDKGWSLRVKKDNFTIERSLESYYYFLKRNAKQSIKRIEIESLGCAVYEDVDVPSYSKIIMVFLNKF